jgi:hypothetical protein
MRFRHLAKAVTSGECELTNFAFCCKRLAVYFKGLATAKGGARCLKVGEAVVFDIYAIVTDDINRRKFDSKFETVTVRPMVYFTRQVRTCH